MKIENNKKKNSLINHSFIIWSESRANERTRGQIEREQKKKKERKKE
jgi:hypothetical protein